MAEYAKNQIVRIYTPTPFNVNGVATDPTTVTLVVMDSAGTKTTYTYAQGQITKSATGIYYKDVAGSLEGDYFWWWYGTGACAAADQGYFSVVDLLA